MHFPVNIAKLNRDKQFKKKNIDEQLVLQVSLTVSHFINWKDKTEKNKLHKMNG